MFGEWDEETCLHSPRKTDVAEDLYVLRHCNKAQKIALAPLNGLVYALCVSANWFKQYRSISSLSVHTHVVEKADSNKRISILLYGSKISSWSINEKYWRENKAQTSNIHKFNIKQISVLHALLTHIRQIINCVWMILLTQQWTYQALKRFLLLIGDVVKSRLNRE